MAFCHQAKMCLPTYKNYVRNSKSDPSILRHHATQLVVCLSLKEEKCNAHIDGFQTRNTHLNCLQPFSITTIHIVTTNLPENLVANKICAYNLHILPMVRGDVIKRSISRASHCSAWKWLLKASYFVLFTRSTQQSDSINQVQKIP